MIEGLRGGRLGTAMSAPTNCIFGKYKPVRYSVVEARVDLSPGQVILDEHLVGSDSGSNLHGYNPITGPFRRSSELVGRVVALDIPAGTVITGQYLVPLRPEQQSKRLLEFWRR